jgi:hypothetical protein
LLDYFTSKWIPTQKVFQSDAQRTPGLFRQQFCLVLKVIVVEYQQIDHRPSVSYCLSFFRNAIEILLAPLTG